MSIDEGGTVLRVDVVGEFAALMGAGGEPLDLALALVAAAGRPQVDPQYLLHRIDDLADAVGPTDAGGLCAAVFRGLGFAGNREDYGDPGNSLLDRVLERRRGIPITLSVLGLSIGRRRGVALVGVGMPGHFLLRDAADPDAFFDAFDGGMPLDRDGCRRLFARIHGATAPFDDRYLEPCDPTATIARVLENLRAARLRRDDRAGLAHVLRLLAAMPDPAIGHRRQLAGVLAAQGRFVEAADVHARLAEDDVQRADEHRAAARRLRASLN